MKPGTGVPSLAFMHRKLSKAEADTVSTQGNRSRQSPHHWQGKIRGQPGASPRVPQASSLCGPRDVLRIAVAHPFSSLLLISATWHQFSKILLYPSLCSTFCFGGNSHLFKTSTASLYNVKCLRIRRNRLIGGWRTDTWLMCKEQQTVLVHFGTLNSVPFCRFQYRGGGMLEFTLFCGFPREAGSCFLYVCFWVNSLWLTLPKQVVRDKDVRIEATG